MTKKTCLYQTSSHLLSKNSSVCRNYTREKKEFRRIILVNFLNISVCCIISSINNPDINHLFQNLNMTEQTCIAGKSANQIPTFFLNITYPDLAPRGVTAVDWFKSFVEHLINCPDILIKIWDLLSKSQKFSVKLCTTHCKLQLHMPWWLGLPWFRSIIACLVLFAAVAVNWPYVSYNL